MSTATPAMRPMKIASVFSISSSLLLLLLDPAIVIVQKLIKELFAYLQEV